MILIVCIDDNGGMLFNGRRLSRDAVLCRQILQISAESTLWMNHYSRVLFPDEYDNISVDDSFLQQAGNGEYCFVENQDIMPYLSKVEKIVIFRWNRKYPSDLKFPLHLLAGEWKKTTAISFPGKSHDEITQEVYCR